MSGQVLAVFSGIFASLASIFSKLALSSAVHALDRHVLSTFCTTEDNEECFPVRTQDITRTIVHACMYGACLLCHVLIMPMCAGVSPAPRDNAVSYARQ